MSFICPSRGATGAREGEISLTRLKFPLRAEAEPPKEPRRLTS
jgi:hypothetical protein